MQRRRVLTGVIVVLLVLAAGWGASRWAMQQFQQAVLASLGPGASVGGWRIGLDGVELRDLRLRAQAGGPLAWPADDELRARRVLLQPEWASLWAAATAGAGEGWRLRRVQIDGAHLTVLRERTGGLHLLPSLTGAPARPGASPGRPARADAATAPSTAPPASGPAAATSHPPAPGPRLRIGELKIEDATVDLHDASIRRPPHRIQVSALQATIGPIDWPALDQPVPIAMQARLAGQAGAGRDGTLSIKGTLTPARRDAQLAVRLRAVDLRLLQPYLLRVNEGGIERGVVDLDLDATLRASRLQAPGRVVFTGLELAERPGVLGSFAGLPQRLVLAAVRERGRIELRFTLAGRLDDPAFSLNENLATRVGVGLAESLGVSVSGAVEGLGQVIKGLFGK